MLINHIYPNMQGMTSINPKTQASSETEGTKRRLVIARCVPAAVAARAARDYDAWFADHDLGVDEAIAAIVEHRAEAIIATFLDTSSQQLAAMALACSSSVRTVWSQRSSFSSSWAISNVSAPKLECRCVYTPVINYKSNPRVISCISANN